MPLRTVTISGADTSMAPADLLEITWDFPFVEWGILLSKKHAHSPAGAPRYPGKDWVERLFLVAQEYQQDEKRPFPISGHLCGQWAKDIVDGFFTFPYDCPNWASKFQRIQINARNLYKRPTTKFMNALRFADLNYILQIDEHTKWVLLEALEMKISAYPFFDASGGRGITPRKWPAAIPRRFTGYAGGLGPDNLEEELARIEKQAALSPFWSDIETKVRANDGKFDIGKVRACLEIAKKHIASYQ